MHILFLWVQRLFWKTMDTNKKTQKGQQTSLQLNWMSSTLPFEEKWWVIIFWIYAVDDTNVESLKQKEKTYFKTVGWFTFIIRLVGDRTSDLHWRTNSIPSFFGEFCVTRKMPQSQIIHVEISSKSTHNKHIYCHQKIWKSKLRILFRIWLPL